MKKWKLITLICSAILFVGIVILLVFIFTDKEEETYKYPTTQPTISNPDRVYLEVGNKKVTMQEMYDLGLISYGITTLIDLVDELVIDTEYSQEEYQEHLKSLYAAYNEIELEEVDFEDEDQKEKFIEQMNYQGYMTEEEMEAAIKLDLMRNKLAEEMLKEDVKNFEPVKDKDGNITQEIYFTDAQIEKAIMMATPDKSEIIYLTFRSESEALKLMEEFDIDKDNLAGGWRHKSNGELFTKDEILDTFVKMYNKLNETDILENKYPVYTQKELSEINSTLASNIFELEDLQPSEKIKACMTLQPKKYATGYYYLAVKNNTTVTLKVEDVKAAIKNNQYSGDVLKVYEQLIDSTLTSSLINTYLYKNRFDKGIKIYDEGLDIRYTNSSSNALSSYLDVYLGTSEESATYLATINHNGTLLQVTADQLLNEMLKRYGSLLATEFINRYMMFNQSYSSVYDYESGNKYSLYDALYKSETLTYKQALEEGQLASYGYPKNYGWENFIKDYFGVQNEAELIMIGNAYTLAVENYALSTFTITSDTANEIYKKFHLAYEVSREYPGSITTDEFKEYLETLDKKSYENTLLYKIMDRLTKYFDVKAGSLKFYVDSNNDTVYDELDENTEKLGQTLIEALFYIAYNQVTEISNPQNDSEVLAQKILIDLKNKEFGTITKIEGSTLGERLARIVTVYNNANLTNETFSVYKLAGIRLVIDQESSYTDESAEEELQKLLKGAWDQVLNKTLVLQNGDVAYFPYTEYANTAVNAKTAENLSASNPYRIDEYYKDDTSISIVFLTSATNSTWYNYHETIVSMFPTKTIDGEQVVDVERLETYLDYYILSNRKETELTTDEATKLSNIDRPATFQSNYINNVISECFKDVSSDESIGDLMYTFRKTAIDEGQIKFTEPTNKANYLKMLEIIFKED